MVRQKISRRSLLSGAGALGYALHAPVTRAARLQKGSEGSQLFGPETVLEMAAALAKQPFAEPVAPSAEQLKKLVYDQYRDIRFRPERALWRGEGLGHEIQFFPLGWLYQAPVEISIVAEGVARRVDPNPDAFTFGPVAGEQARVAAQGFSGFRLHRAINRADYLDEYLVFQGASYFRAVARGENYGLSARGLSLSTAQPSGEEFPLFRAFWIERPQPGAREIVIHALLDSASTAGAFRFSVAAGVRTEITVQMTMFPRRELSHAGIAPMTSMYLLGPADMRRRTDFRPAVHDSDGLSIATGRGEYIWRPLTNPKLLQASAFIDKDLRGFGLMQRERRFSAYEDLEAHYERRPSCWVEPEGAWGEGHVELIEIPTEEEIHDNIAVAWRPKQPIPALKPASLGYRLIWSGEHHHPGSLMRVSKTRMGPARNEGSQMFVVDFDGAWMSTSQDLPKLDLKASTGTIESAVLQPNPETKGLRASFVLNPAGEALSEIAMKLLAPSGPISETWVYRWTKS